MDKKLYIGNLPYSVTDQDLKTLFEKSGSVTSAVVITDRNSGRSKGFGFVEMSSESEVEDAIQQFNGYEWDGREIKVSIAKPREERDRRRPGRGKGMQGGNRPGRRDTYSGGRRENRQD